MLTPTQAQTLAAIAAHKRKHDGCPPTTRELARALGLGPTAALARLASLRAIGAIVGAGRRLEVAGAVWMSPDEAAQLLADRDGVIIAARGADPARSFSITRVSIGADGPRRETSTDGVTYTEVAE